MASHLPGSSWPDEHVCPLSLTFNAGKHKLQLALLMDGTRCGLKVR